MNRDAPDRAPDIGATSTGRRTILHVDMDAFYVSVELLRRPDLRGRPVVVGGTGRRGVVAAASYEARRFGIRSAMPSATAHRLCPDAVFLPGDHARYAEVSAQVHEVFHSVTPLVEPLALDEAFLDVSGALRLLGDGERIARRLRDDVYERVGLRCSVGVATSKFLAKLASEEAKPRATPAGVEPGKGVFVVVPGEELAFLHPLPVSALWGVGATTLARLERIGIRTVGDLARVGEASVVRAVGEAHGRHLHRLANGIDERPVEVDRAMKSIGHEETFPRDLHSAEELHRELVRMADAVAARLRAAGTGARTITLKVRFHDFHTITRSVTVDGSIDTAHDVVEAVTPLLAGVLGGAGVRLLGISGSNFAPPAKQLSLDALMSTGPDGGGEADADWHGAETTVDAIRDRFGSAAIGPASALRGGRLRIARRGGQQWGPDAGDGERPQH